jgi:alpha-1,3-rhamnosyl/mannosyltransferase
MTADAALTGSTSTASTTPASRAGLGGPRAGAGLAGEVLPVALEVSSLLVEAPSGIAVFGRSLLESLNRLETGRPFLHLVYKLGRHRRARDLDGLQPHPYLWGLRLQPQRFPLLHALDTRFPPAYRGRLVATLYDVLSALPISRDRQLASRAFRAKKLRQYRAIAERSDAVLAISAETRDRFRDACGYRGEIRIVRPGVHPCFRPRAPDAACLRALGLEWGEYLLFVGDLCRRKNLEGVIRAFQKAAARYPRLKLALVGKPSFGWSGSPASRWVAEAGGRIRTLGFLDQETLAMVYAGARAFLFLSHYEGFGLPVLEAMASGVPVIASRRGGIPEAAQGAALLVDPDDYGAVDGALGRILDSESERRHLRQLGLERARESTWRRAALGVEELYRHLLARV